MLFYLISVRFGGDSMRKKASIAVLTVLCLSMLIVFQNCGSDLPTNYFSSQGGSNDLYTMKVDQLAYMSCAEQQDVANEQGMFFTFRAGAYGDTAGLSLSSSFLEKYKYKKNREVLSILEQDTIIGGSQIQFSVRKQSNLAQMFISNGSSDGVDGLDYDFTFGILGSEELSASLLTTNSTRSGWLNYWSPAGVNYDAYFQGTMTFNNSESDANAVRNAMTAGGYVLTTAFGDTTNAANIRFPDYTVDDDTTNDDSEVPSNVAFGVGLKLGFKQPTPLNWNYAGTPYISMPKRVLASVSEYDLSSPSRSKGTWTCPTNLQFRVIYPTDATLADNTGVGTPLCGVAEDPASPSADLLRVRNSLPSQDWYVDMAKKCIVPRRAAVGSCYGIDAGTKDTRRVNYKVTTACNPDIVNASADVCAHFVSICYKTL
jgi:hypothetical protein